MSLTFRKSLAVLATALFLVVLGCSNGEERPTVQVNPSSTPKPTATAGPTATATIASTPTPAPTPTPSPTPTPTPTPVAPNAAFLAQLNLANRLEIGPNTISITDYDEATWPSSDYGCPLPGTVYQPVVVSGWKVLLKTASGSYEYHTDDSGEVLINCTENRDIERRTINIVGRGDLRSTTLIEMRRRDSTGEFVLKSTVTDSAEIKAIVDTLDVPVLLAPAAPCTEIFRLVFITSSGNHTIGTICGGNSRLIRGDQAFWGGQDAQATAEFGAIIGPYFSNEPIPSIPS